MSSVIIGSVVFALWAYEPPAQGGPGAKQPGAAARVGGADTSGSGQPTGNREKTGERRAPARPAWNAEKAAHLLRRAGFGGSPEQIQFLARLGRDRAVDYLVDYQKIPFQMDPPKVPASETYAGMRQDMRGMSQEERKKFQQQFRLLQEVGLREMTNWWIARMVATSRPLEEKMVLFWHGHFTSGMREVKRARALCDQNDLYRRMAVGNFRDLVLAVSRDPAMLAYLNNAQNRKQKPNENYARELMELFTLGIGHYTEQDIKEAARAFTGWTVNPQTGQYAFFARAHDFGPKTFLGRKGTFDGTDIVDIILQQPACAEHMVRRLWRFFASEEAPEPVVKRLATVFRDSKYELKPLLKAIFRSDAFYDAKVMHAHVKSPVELVVGTLRSLEVEPDDCTAFAAACRMMGQELFQPPNVKGWDGGLAWINTASLFNRYNLLGYIVYGTPSRPPQVARRLMGLESMMMQMDPKMGVSAESLPDPDDFMRNQAPFDPMPIVTKLHLDSAEKIVDHFVARLLQQKISPERRRVLIDELQRVGGTADCEKSADAIRGVIHLIVSMPEYQLN